MPSTVPLPLSSRGMLGLVVLEAPSPVLSKPDGERKNYISQWAVKGKWGSENRAFAPAASAFCFPRAVPTGGGLRPRGRAGERGGRERTSGAAGAVERAGGKSLRGVGAGEGAAEK